MLAAALAAAGPSAAQAPPLQVFVLRAEYLSATRTSLWRRDTAFANAYTVLLSDAKEALALAPISVTQKKRVAPSGDRHDYMSIVPGWWPDSTKPDGIPYLRRDATPNPETRDDSDTPRFVRLANAVQTLALAYYLSADESYARHAAVLLRAWFLDSATRMTPHLRFGLAVPGVAEGHGFALIDTRELSGVIDAVGMLEGSASWTASDQRGMVDWSRAFLQWMKTSKQGQEAAAEKNDHGTWIDVLSATLALFVGDSAFAREVITRRTLPRVASLIRPDGSQPSELARTRSWTFSTFNADAFTRAAELSRWVGVDLWHYTSPGGSSIRGALRYLAPYADSTKPWPGQQVTPDSPLAVMRPYRRADQALGDAVLRTALQKISAGAREFDRSRLLYPDAP
ncbi:MAG: alginate lyase family protein [Gemmatimonadota bacterium]|nr:alginate lyase family protein [Gemmatimonadota bacterium]